MDNSKHVSSEALRSSRREFSGNYSAQNTDPSVCEYHEMGTDLTLLIKVAVKRPYAK